MNNLKSFVSNVQFVHGTIGDLQKTIRYTCTCQLAMCDVPDHLLCYRCSAYLFGRDIVHYMVL